MGDVTIRVPVQVLVVGVETPPMVLLTHTVVPVAVED